MPPKAKKSASGAPSWAALLESRSALPETVVEFRTGSGDVIEVGFRAVPAFTYERLIREHPPLEGSLLVWEPEGFVPAALAAASVPDELDETFWRTYCSTATSRTVAELIDVVQTLNATGSVERRA